MKAMAFSLFILLSQSALADNKSLSEFYNHFKAGRYQKAIDSLEALNVEENSLASKYYLEGLSFARLQEYDKAKDLFEKAIEEKSDAQDLHYEYGQALYAGNFLKKSRSAFQNSAKIGYNRPASLYYVGHISQMLEDYPTAKNAYLEILKDKSVDSKMEQISKFQLAETGLSIIREQISKSSGKDKDKEKLITDIDKKVIPLLKAAYDTDSKSPVAFDIDKRIKEILKEFDLDPDVMKNGRRISSKRFSATLDMKTKFDDNVTNTNLENDVQQSHKESFFVETEADLKYDFAIKKKFIVSPEFRLNYNKYANQDDSDVYQNDATFYTLVLNNKYEHTAFNNPASFLLNLDYSKTYKDYLKIHDKKYYSKSTTLTIGEQFSYFATGDTTFKFKYKNFTAYTDTLNNHTVSLSADQTLAIKNNQLLIILLEGDFVNNFNSQSTSTNAYMLRFDYVIPEIFTSYSLTASFTTTLTDTLDLQATRGYETTLNPSIELSKEITDKLKAIISFDYTKNKSKSSDYTYQKYVTNFELKYSF